MLDEKYWNVVDFSSIAIEDLHRIQSEYVDQKKKDPSRKDTLLFAEVLPVFTKGRNFQKKNLLKSSDFLKKKQVSLISVDRGGDITYHGIGQLLVYFVANLNDYGRDLRHWVYQIEEIAIDVLSDFSIKAHRQPNERGVWVDDGKIASIGLGCSGWICYHGLSLNIDIPLEPFSWINPCGIEDLKTVSIKSLKGNAPSRERVKTVWKNAFEKIMGVKIL